MNILMTVFLILSAFIFFGYFIIQMLSLVRKQLLYLLHIICPKLCPESESDKKKRERLAKLESDRAAREALKDQPYTISTMDDVDPDHKNGSVNEKCVAFFLHVLYV